MSLTVAIPDTFSGPLDLLLHLIRRDEMDIHDIPIARLTASYLAEMDKLDIVDVDEAAEFLDLASRLLEIKSRMLVPREDEAEGEEGEDDDLDPRSGLVEALLEYRRFKEAARLLGDLAEEQGRRYPRVAPRLEFTVIDEAPLDADVMDLFSAFQSMILRIVPADESTEITYTEVPTSVRIRQIEEVLVGLGKTRFSLLLSEKPTRREMVGFFIAILELVRQGRIVARQSVNFADIVIEKAAPRVRLQRTPAFQRAPARALRKGSGKTRARTGKHRSPRSVPALFPPAPRTMRPSSSVFRPRIVPAFPPVGGAKTPAAAKRTPSARAPRFFC